MNRIHGADHLSAFKNGAYYSLMESWFVYIIRCKNGSLYTGCTNHIIRRWHEHIEGKGAKYLKANKPDLMVHVEEHPNQSEAAKREYEIKQYSKKKKEDLILKY